MTQQIQSFDFQPGRKVGPRYVVESRLGGGSEGEVYKIRELDTGICRAAKLYYPHRDPDHSRSIIHARKLEVLRHCSIVLQYHHSEILTVRKRRVIALISDLCEGEQLESWIARHPGGYLPPYISLHVLYNLVRGIEAIHALGQYHADVHSQNILIRPLGVRFEMKLIDFYDWGPPAAYKQQQDIKDTIRVFYECLGGKPRYSKLPEHIRYICANLQRKRMLQRFPTMTALRTHLEQFEWSNSI